MPMPGDPHTPPLATNLIRGKLLTQVSFHEPTSFCLSDVWTKRPSLVRQYSALELRDCAEPGWGSGSNAMCTVLQRQRESPPVCKGERGMSWQSSVAGPGYLGFLLLGVHGIAYRILRIKLSQSFHSLRIPHLPSLSSVVRSICLPLSAFGGTFGLRGPLYPGRLLSWTMSRGKGLITGHIIANRMTDGVWWALQDKRDALMSTQGTPGSACNAEGGWSLSSQWALLGGSGLCFISPGVTDSLLAKFNWRWTWGTKFSECSKETWWVGKGWVNPPLMPHRLPSPPPPD